MHSDYSHIKLVNTQYTLIVTKCTCLSIVIRDVYTPLCGDDHLACIHRIQNCHQILWCVVPERLKVDLSIRHFLPHMPLPKIKHFQLVIYLYIP